MSFFTLFNHDHIFQFLVSEKVIHHKTLAFHFKSRPSWFEEELSLSWYASTRWLDYFFVHWFTDRSLDTFLDILSGWSFIVFQKNAIMSLRFNWVRDRLNTLVRHTGWLSVVEIVGRVRRVWFNSRRRSFFIRRRVFQFIELAVHKRREEPFLLFLLFSWFWVWLGIVQLFLTSLFDRQRWVVASGSSCAWVCCFAT